MERKNPKDVTYYQYDKQGNTVSELTKRFLKPETVKTQNGSITTICSSLEKTELEQYKTYEYDCFNKAAKVTVDNYTNGTKTVHTQENFYDAENLRYGIEEDGERTNFVTNGWSVFTELDAEWTTTKRLVRGYGIVASEEIGTATITDVGSGYSNGYHYYHQTEHGDIEYITGKDGKLENAYTYDAFGNITNSTELIWTSNEGLIYGQSQDGNRVIHVLKHTTPDSSKPLHSVYNVDKSNVIGLVDEAWTKRGNGIMQGNGNVCYNIDMGRVIGTNNESVIRIITRGYTNEIITAFPKGVN